MRCRDPYIYTDHQNKVYYLYSWTSYHDRKNDWGVDVYKSLDLDNWELIGPCFERNDDFWATKEFWAPEIHKHNNAFYMFISLKSDRKKRGTQILKSSSLLGPFKPISKHPQTPRGWDCLDGTFYLDNTNTPWIVYCHEWVQIGDGTIVASRLKDDLSEVTSNPVILFNASSANWIKPFSFDNVPFDKVFVTDGPYFHITKSGKIIMLWSSYSKNGYCISQAKANSLFDKCEIDDIPLYESDGGHPMIFKTFDNNLKMIFHTPNKWGNEKIKILDIYESNYSLMIKKGE